MKKIGGVGVKFFNYGTVLQLYALQEAVKGLGYEYEVIDYSPAHPAHENIAQRLIRRVPEFLDHPSDAAQALFLKVAMRHPKRTVKFRAFLNNHMNIGEKKYKSCEDLESDPPAYDAFVCGSDQIWNPRCYGNDPTFFLAFAPRPQRVAYAPSIGLSRIQDDQRDTMKSLLEGITHLSVREKAGAEIIKQLTGRKASVVLDPTLLLEAETWSHISSPVNRNRPYILCYFLESDDYARKFVFQLARQNSHDVVFILLNYRDLFYRNIIKIRDAGPKDFLGLIRNASVVCTDSFHATAFSVQFRRPFYSFRRYTGNAPAQTFSRIENLLETVNLTSRILGRDSAHPREPLAISFSDADTRLHEERKRSLEYLSNSLYAATEYN
jgi:hypothetical protein